MFYLEACESGSIFEGLLPEDLNIYATTASNADESSWGTYCPGDLLGPPPEYCTCLGDLYSVSWMEDRYLSFSHWVRNEIYSIIAKNIDITAHLTLTKSLIGKTILRAS